MTEARRAFQIEVRAAEGDDAPAGSFISYPAVYGNEYPVGPNVREELAHGVFDASIAARGGVMPIYGQHDWRTGGAPIGHATVTSDALGPRFDGVFYIDDSERARVIHRAMVAGALREWSVGFLASEITERRNPDGSVTEVVTRGDLLEGSVVLKGANPETTTVSVREEEAASAEEQTPATPPIPENLLANIGDAHVRDIIRPIVHPSV